ncbi:MAG: response regulator, partial [Planctomycetaceae bacterium]|nr:response regulator [Planctomycetaceae bacterium]
QRAGCHVTMAENGEAGLNLALSRPFDIILMDMQMPVMDGYSATRSLRQAGVTTPVVALTAHAMNGDREKCLDAGCTEFLTKPLEFAVLLRTIDSLLPAETHASRSAEGPAVPEWQDSLVEPDQPSESLPGSGPVLRSEPLSRCETTVSDCSEDGSPATRMRIESSLPCHADDEFREIVDDFYDRMLERLDRVEAAVRSCDRDQVIQLSHWLKGSGGTAGFAPLMHSAAILERAAREGRDEQLQRLLADVREVADAIVLPWRSDSPNSDSDCDPGCDTLCLSPTHL